MNQENKKSKFEVERDEACRIFSIERMTIYKAATFTAFEEGADWGAAYERERAEKLVDVLRMVENRSLDWDRMHTKNSLEILQDFRGKCFEALAAYESGE